jgi:hypothetical protein
MRILSIDPSGTGTTGLFFTSENQKEFFQIQNTNWKEHYAFISQMVKDKQPNLILYEDTNYIHRKTKDGLSLFRLLGALECLSAEQVSSVNVVKVKEMSKKLLAGIEKIEGLEYLVGRGKGWMYEHKRVSIHQLEAFIVYYLFTRKI